MTDNDTKLLTEAYARILTEKALTLEQLAKKAKPAGSGVKTGSGSLTKNKEDKKIKKTLSEPPYTDQNMKNFNQDGEDTAVKDRYTIKENTVPGSFEATFKKIDGEAAKEIIRVLYTNSNEEYRRVIIYTINTVLDSAVDPYDEDDLGHDGSTAVKPKNPNGW